MKGTKQNWPGRCDAVARLVLGCAGVLLVAGCDRIAVEPGAGRLQGEWTVNQMPECEIPRGVPVLAKLRVRNVDRWRVKLPENVAPDWGGGDGEVTWRVLRPLPGSVAPGAEVEAWWLLEGDVAAGRYEVGFGPEIPIPAVAGVVSIRDEAVPGPLLLEQRAAVAKLSGTAADLAAELQKEPDDGRLPTTRLALAGLLREAGDEEGAARELERFAEEIYGAEGLPNWLQRRMKDSAKSEPASP